MFFRIELLGNMIMVKVSNVFILLVLTSVTSCSNRAGETSGEGPSTRETVVSGPTSEPTTTGTLAGGPVASGTVTSGHAADGAETSEPVLNEPDTKGETPSGNGGNQGNSTASEPSLLDQGMLISIKTSLPNFRATVDSATCVSAENILKINEDNTISALQSGSCLLKKNTISFSVYNSTGKLFGLTLKISYTGSAILNATYDTKSTEILEKSEDMQAFILANHIAVAATLYPHYGLSKTLDKLLINIGPSPESWQESKGEKLAGTKLVNAIFPGSHDTGTYKIGKSSFLTADLPSEFLKYIENTSFMSIFTGWAKSQNLSVFGQLKLGVRYLDIRLCGSDYKKIPTEIYTCHALAGGSFKDIVDDLALFFSTHPKELVILDMNHIYGISNMQIEAIYALLKNKLGSKLAAPNNFTVNDTFDAFWKQNKQIIAIMDNDNAVKKYGDIFWSKENITSPWPNTTDPSTLLKAMETNLKSNTRKQLFVLQAQETPNTLTIIEGLNKIIGDHPSTLFQLTTSYKPQVQKWLEQNTSLLAAKGNIIIEDFEDGLFLMNLINSL